MTTIIIDDQSAEAKKMIEFVKTLPYATIMDEKSPGPTLRKSMQEVKEGKTKEIKDVKEYFKEIRKKANV